MGGHQRGEKGCGPEIALEGRREGGARGGSTGAWEGRDADPQEGPLGGVQGWEALEGPVPGRGGGAGRGQSSQSDLGLGRSNLAEAGRVRSEWRGWEALGKAVEGPTPGKRRRWPGEGGGEWTALEMAGIYAGEGRAAGWKRGGGGPLGGVRGWAAVREVLQGPTPGKGRAHGAGRLEPRLSKDRRRRGAGRGSRGDLLGGVRGWAALGEAPEEPTLGAGEQKGAWGSADGTDTFTYKLSGRRRGAPKPGAGAQGRSWGSSTPTASRLRPGRCPTPHRPDAHAPGRAGHAWNSRGSHRGTWVVAGGRGGS